jgi:hypothetical protein
MWIAIKIIEMTMDTGISIPFLNGRLYIAAGLLIPQLTVSCFFLYASGGIMRFYVWIATPLVASIVPQEN